MTALRSAGLAEAFADRRTSIGVLATLALPVLFLAFIAQSTVGQIGTPLVVRNPLVVVIAAVAGGFLYAVANGAFAAATFRRRARYELMASMGAQRRHLTELLRWELGLPGALGIGLGLLAGIVLAEIFEPLDAEFEPSDLGSPWLGAISVVILVGTPAAAGVWAAARSSASRIGEPRGGVRDHPRVDVQRFRRIGLVTLVVSGPLLGLSLFGLLHSDSSLAELLLFGVAIGVVGLLLGAVFLVPAILSLLTDAFAVDNSGGSALAGLADRPQRAMAFTGGVLVLTTLTVMASAGLLSDEEEFDDPGDRRQVVAATFAVANGSIEEVANRHDNSVLGTAEFVPETSAFFEERFVSDAFVSSSFHTTHLTDELIAILELDAADVEFARQGGLLVDSDVLGEIVTIARRESPDDPFTTEPVAVRRVRRGGGVGQPGPEGYAFLEDPLSVVGGPPSQLVRFVEPMSAEMVADLRAESVLEFPSEDSGDFGVLVLGLVGVLLFSLALAGSNLAAVELDDEFATLVALGASPRIRPKILALQMGWQLVIGLTFGSLLGILFFWVVTRGDPSVPNAIVPVGAIVILALSAAVAVGVIALLHGPAEPTVSSRVSAMVEV